MKDATVSRAATADRSATRAGGSSSGRPPSRSIPPQQQRLARRIAAQANRILEPHEDLLALTEAVEDAGTWPRNILGMAWPRAYTVALLFTPRRLIEIGVGSAPGEPNGRVRSFPWDGVPSLAIEDGWLTIRTWDEHLHRWYLRDAPDPRIEGMLLKRVNLAVSTYVPSLSRTAPVVHCSRCAAAPLPPSGSCRRCAAVVRSPARAAALAVAASGAGHLYAQRPMAAAVRLVAEVAVFALMCAVVLGTTDPWRVLAGGALGLVLLALARTHAALSARTLAERAGTVAAAADRRWRLVVPIGAVASVAIATAPFLLTGSLDRNVDWGLAFSDSEDAWSVTRPPFGPELAGIPGLQEMWTRRDGQWILVQAWPFRSFETAARATARLGREWGASGGVQRLGSHEVLQARGEARGLDGARLETLVVLIIDAPARDVHALTTPVDADGVAADRLRQLVARSYWVTRDAR